MNVVNALQDVWIVKAIVLVTSALPAGTSQLITNVLALKKTMR
jgi:hypothetical protein